METQEFPTPASMPVRMHAAFDGGRRCVSAGPGWLLLGSWSETQNDWPKIADGCTFLNDCTTVLAELHGATQAVAAAVQYVQRKGEE